MTELQQQYSFLSNPFISSLLKEKEPNLLAIAKVNYKELPISNLYAYFLNPDEHHGLNNLFLDSLVELIEGFSFSSGPEAITIAREVHTYKTGNYIDLVISNGRQVIVIENKINADLYNNLNTYIDHYKDKVVKGVILARKNVINPYGFVSITHNQLIKRVVSNLTDASIKALNQRQLYNFNTFVEVLKNMDNITEDLDKNIDFFRSNANQIRAFQLMKSSFINTLLQQINELVIGSNLGLASSLKDLHLECNIKDAPCLVLYFALQENNLTELIIELWIRNNPDKVQKWRNTNTYNEEKENIKKKGFKINTDSRGGNAWTPTVTKSYQLNSTNNQLDNKELELDLLEAWKTTIDTLKTITSL